MEEIKKKREEAMQKKCKKFKEDNYGKFMKFTWYFIYTIFYLNIFFIVIYCHFILLSFIFIYFCLFSFHFDLILI